MSTIITINGTVTLDESAGLQNTGIPVGDEDNNDNDVSLATLMTDPTASVFYDRLFGNGVGELNLDTTFASTIGVAASAEDFVTISSDGSINGASLDVVDGTASGLFTLDDTEIFLYNDPTNPDIILGRVGTEAGAIDVADPNGDIAFALYLDLTFTDVSNAVGQMWIVQLQPLAKMSTPTMMMGLCSIYLASSAFPSARN